MRSRLVRQSACRHRILISGTLVTKTRPPTFDWLEVTAHNPGRFWPDTPLVSARRVRVVDEDRQCQILSGAQTQTTTSDALIGTAKGTRDVIRAMVQGIRTVPDARSTLAR